MKNISGNILSDFLEDIYSSGLAQGTVSAYRKDVAYFIQWFINTSGQGFNPVNITSIDLREYQEHMQSEQYLKPATINRRMAALEKYIRWMHGKGYIDCDCQEKTEPFARKKLSHLCLEKCEPLWW